MHLCKPQIACSYVQLLCLSFGKMWLNANPISSRKLFDFMSLRADEFLQTPDSQARKTATVYIYLELLASIICFAYCTRAIINHSLYIFTPFFTAVYIVEWYYIHDSFSSNLYKLATKKQNNVFPTFVAVLTKALSFYASKFN